MNLEKKISKEAELFFKNKKILFAAWACENKYYDSYQKFYGFLNNIFGKIISFDPQKNINFYGKKAMNKKFLETLEKEKPDYLFLWLIYDEFYLKTLEKIREISPNTIIINYFSDDDSQFESFSRYYLLFIDYALCMPHLSKEIYKKEGINSVFFTHLADTNKFKPLNIEKKWDVTFVGTPKVDRAKLILYLKNKGVNIRVYGWGWEAYPEFKSIYGGALNNEEFIKIINQSKINLSFTKNYFEKPHLKGRIFESGACKSFALVEYYSLYLKFFKDKKEIVMFKDKEDLLNKINYYLKNEEEREIIANNAYKRVIEYYNLEFEINSFFQKIFFEHKNFIKKRLPEINDKVLTLKKKDLDSKVLKEKLSNFNYICFSNGDNNHVSENRDYFQMYSLKKSKKPISCCDYYVYSHGLGNYMLFNSHYAFKTIPKKDFLALFNIGQIMVKKDYFLKHIAEFKTLFKGKEADIINEDNIVFVSIPLIKIKKINILDYPIMEKVFIMGFIEELSSQIHQKNLSLLFYCSKLIIKSLSLKKLFMLKYTLKRSLNKLKI